MALFVVRHEHAPESCPATDSDMGAMLSWYAVASVKWLTEIELIDTPFTGRYQTDTYSYERERDGEVVREPSRCNRYVRSSPSRPTGNRLGYGNNSIQEVAVEVR
jgi:hypothetical protein